MLAAHTAAGSFIALAFLPIFGLHSAVEAMVEDSIDAGAPRQARYTALVGLSLDLALWAVLAIVILLARTHIAAMYTGHTQTQELLAGLLCVWVASGFCDSVQSVMGGIARGLGLSQEATVIFVVSYYCI